MVIKIIGIILAILILIIVLFLLLRIKLIIGFYENGKFEFKTRFLCFTFGGKKPKKEESESNFTKNFKQKSGLDILKKEELKNSIEQGTFTDKVSRLAALVMLFLGQVKYLYSKIRVDRIYTMIICGGDGAEAAINYGIVCSAVYPLVGYLDASLNMKKDAQSIEIFCNFENDNKIEFELILSIRTVFLLKAFFNALKNGTRMAKLTEESQNGN